MNKSTSLSVLKEEQIRQNSLDTYNVLSMSHTLQENIDLTFDNLDIFKDEPDGYFFKYWSRINSLFIEDLLAHQQQIL